MKLTLVNRILIALSILVFITGVVLHAAYGTLLRHHASYMFWRLSHIILAGLLTVIAVWHIIKNKWWLKTLKVKLAGLKPVMQRIFTPLVFLLFLALFITGLCMLCGWYAEHSHIWIWHFILGVIWGAAVIVHALAFRRKKKVKSA